LELSGRERRNLGGKNELRCEREVAEEQEDEPAQFTSELGEKRDLYACHSNDAVLAKLLGISKLCLFKKASRDEREMHGYEGAYQT
jgi:hypothetical protein